MTEFTRYSDAERAREPLARAIAAHGWSVEHNLEHYLHGEDADQKLAYLATAEGYGVLALDADGYWQVLADPVSPREEAGRVLADACASILQDAETESVYMECTTAARRDLLPRLAPLHLRSRTIAETLTWPVVDLTALDLAWPGGAFKELRNVKSRFLREHRVEVVGTASVDPKQLHAIVDRWKKGRPARHRAHPEEYHALIDDHFAGTLGGRVLVVDGAPEAFSAGWQIPRSEGGYYHGVALHSYRYWGLGEYAMLEDLAWLKHAGYRWVDLGGSDKALLSFKMKFGAVPSYKTHIFSVVRKDEQRK